MKTTQNSNNHYYKTKFEVMHPDIFQLDQIPNGSSVLTDQLRELKICISFPTAIEICF